jgi:hypothetical protein
MTVDGIKAYDAPADPAFMPGLLTLSAGINYAPPPVGPLTVLLDNVLVIAN